jgi:sensor histidine kinase YesM
MKLQPLSEGNALQRAYARWAARRYACMAPELREQAELLDRFLYSRSGLGVWLGLAGALLGTSFGLRGFGLPWDVAVIPFIGLAAWLQPGKFAFQQLRTKFWLFALPSLFWVLCGFVLGHVVRHGALDLEQLVEELVRKGGLLVLATLAAVAAMAALQWGVARVRQDLLERADTERRAAEARLQLLQAQIQPHFIFNTLAALQHWVDTGDARAPALLRTLVEFLRGSTDLLGRRDVCVGEEAEVVRQYLQIMQTRLGERLRYEITLQPAAATATLPPGLLLTLVENAVEHGIAPALAGGTVRVAAAVEGEAVVLRVHDDGIGLAPHWHDGTGLANSRERLRHHGQGTGTLVLHATPPGTEAVLTLPRPAP